jgi:hypothetical protein
MKKNQDLIFNWLLKNRNNIVMPSIQRDFVWKESQILKLFNSIFKGYCIGMFWLWRPKHRTELEKIGYWLLPVDYNIKNEEKNVKVHNKCIIGIVDGQQRLSSLSIGLFGYYNGKELFFNPKKKIFKFFDSAEDMNLKIWIKVKDILQGKGGRLHKNVSVFRNNLKKSIFLSHELNGDINEITDIFIRVNTGGTPLSNNQYLLTKLTEMRGQAIRNKIEKLRKKLRESMGIKVDYDFIIKTALFLSDAPIKIRINSDLEKYFNSKANKKFFNNIEHKWDKIEKAIIKTRDTVVKRFGFKDNEVISKNALIPVAYMYYKGRNEREDIIKKYLYISFLKGVYGGSSDATLQKVRNIMIKNPKLSILLKDDLFVVSDHDISDMLKHKKSNYTKVVLRILYDKYRYDSDHGSEFAQDHMHPSKFFESKEKLAKALMADGIRDYQMMAKEKYNHWKKLKDYIPNLRILNDIRNSDKSAIRLDDWNKEHPIYKEGEFLSSRSSLLLKDFETFYNTRTKKMKIKLKSFFR